MKPAKKQPLFSVFDIVQIIDTNSSLKEIDRYFGIVLGKSHDSRGGWNYAVDVYSDARCQDPIDGWCIDETNLVATGKQVQQDHIYLGNSVKVSPS